MEDEPILLLPDEPAESPFEWEELYDEEEDEDKSERGLAAHEKSTRYRRMVGKLTQKQTLLKKRNGGFPVVFRIKDYFDIYKEHS